MQVVEVSREVPRCGMCGRALDDRHAHEESADPAPKPGKRVVYTVVDLRGATVIYQPVGDPSRTCRTGAAGLASSLGIDASELIGLRFSCWVEPAEHGVFRSEFRLVES